MPKNLLLADDSITIQKVVGITFANEDYKVTSVDNGEDAINKARELRPDVILADVVMPRKNGYEVCEAVKSTPELKGIPVILLAGTFEAFDESRARAAHADGHISKPFESQALINKVRELVEGKAPPAGAGIPSRAVATAAPAAAPPAAARPAAPPAAAPRPPVGPGPMRPPGQQIPPGARPPGPGVPPAGLRPGMPMPPGARPPGPVPPGARPPMPMPPGARPPGPGMPPGARPPGPGVPPGARPGAPIPPGARPPAAGPMPRPPPGAPPQARPLAPVRPPAAPPAAPPMARPAPVPAPAPAAQPRPAPRKDPFGLDDAPGASAPAPVAPSLADSSGPDLSWEDSSEPAAPSLDVSMDEAEADAAEPQGIELPEVDGPGPELAPMHTFVPPPESTGHQPEAAADAGERVLREALSKASREVIERVVWEVVPELAETIIRENLDRLVKGRQK